MDISKYFPSIAYLIYIGIMLFIFFLINLISPTTIELQLFYYWYNEGIFNGLLKSWPIFLWGFIVTLCSLILINQETLKSENILYAKYASYDSSLFQCFIDSLKLLE